ncbi:MAG: sulfatase [Bryobacterales bacterium]|nr:sulfatase [Bryobacterales bacterium]
MRPHLRGPALAAIAALAIGAATSARAANAVLIVSDDQGYADISCYPGADEARTPNIDRLAAEGVRFTNGYASCPVCAPTRAGLLTGRYQQRFGFYEASDSRAGLPTDEVTLANLLQDAGFATGVFGKWHLGYTPEHRPVRRGFDTFYGFLGHGGHDYFDLSISDEATSIYRDAEPVADSGYLTRNITREAVRFIERHRNRPFFAYIPYSAVHNPLQAPPDYVRRFSEPDPRRNTYLAMLTILDEGVGQILDALDRLELAEDTLVVYFSDNGGARGTTADNGRLRGFKHSVFEGGIRVPFLARWPRRIPAGLVSDEPVISIDAFATILAAAGVDVPEGVPLDSRDFLPAAQGRPLEAPLHGALHWNWVDKGSPVGWAIRQGRWKLLADKGEPELYDLEADISEERDLAKAHPQVAAELLKAYRAWEAGTAPRIRRPRRSQ